MLKSSLKRLQELRSAKRQKWISEALPDNSANLIGVCHQDKIDLSDWKSFEKVGQYLYCPTISIPRNFLFF